MNYENGMAKSMWERDCPCVSAGKPRYYCWIAAPDCLHGLPNRSQIEPN